MMELIPPEPDQRARVNPSISFETGAAGRNLMQRLLYQSVCVSWQHHRGVLEQSQFEIVTSGKEPQDCRKEKNHGD